MNYPRTSFSLIAGSLLLITSASLALAAQPAYSVIYRSPAPDNAAQPPFTASKTGNALYATTEGGGAFGRGSVISLTPARGSWLQTTLYSFTGDADGTAPAAGLVLASDGSLYGTTSATVFHLVPPSSSGKTWTRQTIYSFSAANLATGNLVMDPSGNLYGTVESNPQNPNPLAIYRLNAPAQSGGTWTGNRIYNFSSSNQVQGGLTVTPAGKVISTIADNVISLQVASDGVTTTVVPIDNLAAAGLFTDAAPLLTPSGSIVLPISSGSQFGEIIELQPPASAGGKWTQSVIFTFNGTDGQDPAGSLVSGKNGNVFGTTYGGGTDQYGTVYELTPPAAAGGTWTQKVLHNFLGQEAGQQPSSGLVTGGSSIFGLARVSGDNLNDLAFEITK